MTFPEVHRLFRDQNPHAVFRQHHGCAPTACTLSAIRKEAVEPSSRIVTRPKTIAMGSGQSLSGCSGLTTTAGRDAPPPRSDTTTGAKQMPSSSIAGKTNRTSRARLRHSDKWFARSPYRAATAFARTPGLNVSSTICAFTSSGHGPASVLFRSRTHVRRPSVRRPQVISSRVLSVSGAGYRSR